MTKKDVIDLKRVKVNGEFVYKQERIEVPYHQSLTSVMHAFLISLIIIAAVIAGGLILFG